jgi:hypothetical protein
MFLQEVFQSPTDSGRYRERRTPHPERTPAGVAPNDGAVSDGQATVAAALLHAEEVAS